MLAGGERVVEGLVPVLSSASARKKIDDYIMHPRGRAYKPQHPTILQLCLYLLSCFPPLWWMKVRVLVRWTLHIILHMVLSLSSCSIRFHCSLLAAGVLSSYDVAIPSISARY